MLPLNPAVLSCGLISAVRTPGADVRVVLRRAVERQTRGPHRHGLLQLPRERLLRAGRRPQRGGAAVQPGAALRPAVRLLGPVRRAGTEPDPVPALLPPSQSPAVDARAQQVARHSINRRSRLNGFLRVELTSGSEEDSSVS